MGRRGKLKRRKIKRKGMGQRKKRKERTRKQREMSRGESNIFILNYVSSSERVCIDLLLKNE